MKISLFAPTLSPAGTPEFLEAVGRTADENGIHALWVPEHVVLFDDYESPYPYSLDNKIPAGGEAGMLDVFGALAFLAGVTDRVRLGTGICLVPQRNPIYTAKEAATVDWLSDGRLDLGIGVGWLREEFEALQVPFEHRGSRTRDYLEVMRTLWCDEVSEFEGEFYTLPACRAYPKPVQSPYPPLFFGGESAAALRRVAEFGKGWYGFNLEPHEIEPHVEALDKLLRDHGRSLDEIEIAISPYLRRPTRALVDGYRDAGVDQLILLLPTRDVATTREVIVQMADDLL